MLTNISSTIGLKHLQLSTIQVYFKLWFSRDHLDSLYQFTNQAWHQRSHLLVAAAPHCILSIARTGGGPTPCDQGGNHANMNSEWALFEMAWARMIFNTFFEISTCRLANRGGCIAPASGVQGVWVLKWKGSLIKLFRWHTTAVNRTPSRLTGKMFLPTIDCENLTIPQNSPAMTNCSV